MNKLSVITSFFIILVIALGFLSCDKEPSFEKTWPAGVKRDWAGPEFWANRLQDWQVANGRLECVRKDDNRPLRTVHLLTTTIQANNQPASFSVNTGLIEENQAVSSSAATGFLVGAGGKDLEYRGAALIHNTPAPHVGYFAGMDANGKVFINEEGGLPQYPEGEQSGNHELLKDLRLKVEIIPGTGDKSTLKISAFNTEGELINESSQPEIPNDKLEGNIALVSHPGDGEHTNRFWFNELEIKGGRMAYQPKQKLGPVAFTMYTLSDGVMKLTAQLMPIAENDEQTASLEIKENGEWKKLARADIITPGYTATFKVKNWNSQMDFPFRVVYHLITGDKEKQAYHYEGLIRKEPMQQETLSVAALACYSHCFSNTDGNGGMPGWINWDYDVFRNIKANWNGLEDVYTAKNIWFPNQDIVDNLKIDNPDLLAFTGDQVYEFKPTGAIYNRGEETIKDYLYKWYLFGWSFREIMDNRPTICIPDDHDVYQGNLWGRGGMKSPPGNRWNDGGYTESAEFVKMVERTQTDHLPDPFDPTPIKQGIEVYYTDMNYGGISFAIIEDRKFKTPPSLDLEQDTLLGERQLNFLNYWVGDWKEDIKMKSVISQTIFAAVNTRNGERNKDPDANGSLPDKRDEALEIIRKGFAFMIAGDQHLGTVVHHGIEEYNDAGYSFAVPSTGCVWPRFWKPDEPEYAKDKDPGNYTGEYEDAFGNKITVEAVGNPHITGHEPSYLHDLGTGYGIIRFDKQNLKIKMELYHRYSDLSKSDPEQYKGWPVTIDAMQNYERQAEAYLPMIKVEGIEYPLIQVIDESNDELVYSVRIKENQFAPKVFKDGKYTVKVGEASGPGMKVYRGLESLSEKTDITLNVSF